MPQQQAIFVRFVSHGRRIFISGIRSWPTAVSSARHTSTQNRRTSSSAATATLQASTVIRSFRAGYQLTFPMNIRSLASVGINRLAKQPRDVTPKQNDRARST
ncbi:hypothetical protein [Pararobbsia silviterrae]|uniref:hypothetical protein n=1 Tax=Pararobbsia silviterrae TaxID=1792498 RepID=UPI0011C3EB7B|nr:hypothetical protein [Pararobbsia silviterrae]